MTKGEPDSMNNHRDDPGRKSAHPAVFYTDTLSPEELDEEFLRKDRIAVLTDVVRRWPAGNDWDLDSFRARYGSRELRIRGGDRMNWRILCRTSTAEYIDFLSGRLDAQHVLHRYTGMNPYAAFNGVEGMEREVDFHGLLPPGYVHTRQMLWLGPAQSLTPLHYDDSGHTFLAQILGRKRVILYPYEQAPLLYPSDIFDFMSVFSEVDLDQPDMERHPKFARAEPIELVLEPGELLVIPCRMWHQIQALDVSLSVSMRSARYDIPLRLRHLYWYLEGALHLVGLYKRKRCLCHIEQWTEADLVGHHPLIQFLVRSGRVQPHGRDLADLVRWRM